MAREETFVVLAGPSKEGLGNALLRGDADGERTTVRMIVLENGQQRTRDVFIRSLERNDFSGEEWRFTGYQRMIINSRMSWVRVSGLYQTHARKGEIRVDRSWTTLTP